MDILCTDKTGTLAAGDNIGQESQQVRRAGWLNTHFQTGMANLLDAFYSDLHPRG